MNITEATKLVAVLKANYSAATVSPETPMAYLFGLEDLDYETVMRAAKIAIRTMKFMPNAAELRELIAEAATDIQPWETAWNEVTATRKRYGVYIGAKWGNDAGHWSTPFVTDALRVVGGYEAICAATFDEEPTIRAQFRNAYQNARNAAIKRVQMGDATSVLGAGDVRPIKAVNGTERKHG